MNSQAIATTILRQLGGFGQLSAMINAKNFIDHGNGLSFKFSNRRGPNYIKITLDPSDTYSIKLGRVRKWELTNEQDISMIFADQLKGLIERETGLCLSL